MKKLLLLISIVVLSACDGGLKPPPESYLRGKITYVGGVDSWPSADSVTTMRLVAFKNPNPTDIVAEVLSDNIYFVELENFVAESEFEILIPDAPVNIGYIAVAWQFSESFFDQLAVGVYTESGDKTKPTPIRIELGDDKTINIEVDFSNLPPQPFE